MDKNPDFRYILPKSDFLSKGEPYSMAWMNEEGRPFDSAVLEREPQIRLDLREDVSSQGGTPPTPRPKPEDIKPQSSRYLAG